MSISEEKKLILKMCTVLGFEMYFINQLKEAGKTKFRK